MDIRNPDDRRLMAQMGQLGVFGAGMLGLSVSRPMSRKRKTYRQELEELRKRHKPSSKLSSGEKRKITDSHFARKKARREAILSKKVSNRSPNSLSGHKRPRAEPPVSGRARRRLNDDPIMNSVRRHFIKKPLDNDMSYQRTYRGKRPKKAGPVLKRGHMYNNESNGEIAAAGVHSLAQFGCSNVRPLLLLETVFKCMLRNLAWRMGQEIRQWADIPAVLFASPATHRFTFTYRRISGGIASTHYPLELVQSWSAIGTQFAKDFCDSIGVGTLSEFHSLTFSYQQISPNSIINQVNLQDAKIFLSLITKVTIQNRTPGAALTDTEVTDITANPIHVRELRVGGNAFVTKTFDSLTANNVCNNVGFCNGIQNLTTRFEDQRLYKHVKSIKHFTLAPGKLYGTTLKSSYNTSIDQLMMYMQEFIEAATSVNSYQPLVRVPIGLSVGFVADKSMDANAGTQFVTVGEQRKSYISGYIKKSPAVLRPEFV